MSRSSTRAGCGGWNALRLGAHNVQSMALRPYGRDLTVVIGRSSRGGCRGELRFTGFQVHALHTGTGIVTYAGSAAVAGLPAGTVLGQVRTPAGPVGVGWGANDYGQAAGSGQGNPQLFQCSSAYGDSMTLGVSGRDGLALESSGGGDLIAAGLPGHRRDGEPLGLLHPAQRAVGGLGCRPGERRSVGARRVPAGPGTVELRCAGP